MSRWAIAATALTLFDAAATAVWLRMGIAEEANPLLLALIHAIGPTPAMLVRAVVGVGLILLLDSLTGRSTLARWALPVITLVLAALAVWHVLGAMFALG